MIRYREHLEKLCEVIKEPSNKLRELMLIESQQERIQDTFVENVNDDDLTVLFNLLDKQRQGIDVLADILM